MEKILTYKDCAKNWNEALPIGNGFMGAMCFGGPVVDRFQLNNDSLWSSGFRNRINPDAKEKMEELRKLIYDGKISEAEYLASEAYCAIPDYQAHYEMLGDLYLIPDSPVKLRASELWKHRVPEMSAECSEYERALDLFSGIHRVNYRMNFGGETGESKLISREAFVSYDYRVLAIKNTGAGARIILERDSDIAYRRPDEKTVLFFGKIGSDGVKYAAAVRVSKGLIKITGKTLFCDDDAEIFVASDTDFYHQNPENYVLSCLNAAERAGYDKIRKTHVSDFETLMNRCTLEISTPSESVETRNLPINERLRLVREGATDLGLVNLTFAFGRYLLISSSRPGSLPANLQGIWADGFNPAWGSKYTININAEMNYWLAENCNLSEFHMPLFELLKRMIPRGREMAEKMYGARGFMAHHNTDMWGDCAPQDTWISATSWQLGAVWLCLHVMEHFRYTRDIKFAAEYMPVFKEAALFIEDTVIRVKEGRPVGPDELKTADRRPERKAEDFENAAGDDYILELCPTISPENTYRLPNGEEGNMCHGATMDSQILREFFRGIREIGKALEEEKNKADKAGFEELSDMENVLLSEQEKRCYEAILSHLPTETVAPNGTIQEWTEPYEEVEPGHRHISHLFGVFPGTSINYGSEIMKAAEATLNRRLSFGGGHTGWSRAWIVNEWARMRKGENAGADIQKYLEKSVLDNMFDNHPPFQIDGNFGIAAGIAECLLQSHNGEITILPALPSCWTDGAVRGLRARGGITADLSWKNGKLLEAVFTADSNTEIRLSGGKKMTLKKGERTIIKSE